MTEQTAIHDAKIRAKEHTRKLLPELAAQLDAQLAAVRVAQAALTALTEQMQAAAETVAALADADTINGLANHWLVEDAVDGLGHVLDEVEMTDEIVDEPYA